MMLDKKEIKKLIANELEKTLLRVQSLKELTKPIEPDCAIGRVSRMDAINNKAINEEALRQTEAKLSGLKIAIERVDDKDFGICSRCSQPIPLGRIMLVPHSRFCARCVD